MSMLTYTFRLYPTKAQEMALLGQFEKCRQLYNAALEERRSAFSKGVKVNKSIQEKELTIIKNEDLGYEEIHTHVLQDVITRLDLAYRGFFRRVKAGKTPGFPRFRSYGMYKSIKFKDVKNNNGFSIVAGGKRIKVSGIGKIKVKMHRDMQGAMHQAIIKLDTDNHWYVKIICENPKIPVNITKTPKNPVGIDIGIKTLLSCSDGAIFENIKPLKQYEEKLAKAQVALSRKKRGSNRRKVQKVIVAKIHTKIRNIREDYLHKASRMIVDRYDFIGLEDLNIKNMIETSIGKSLTKGICDIAASSFIFKTLYKAENAGILCLLVDPKNTSKMCSCCGNIKKELKLSDRIYKCEKCGLIMDRDLNAAKNILIRALELFEDYLRESEAFGARAEPAQMEFARSPYPNAL